MRGPWVFNVLVCAALGGFSLTARGDTPAAGSDEAETPPGWRLTQTDPGPASALWHRADLTPTEQAYLDQAAVNPNAEAIGAAYASAMSERAAEAAASAAADELGLEGLGSEGVVP
jgi:hypothetical protein